MSASTELQKTEVAQTRPDPIPLVRLRPHVDLVEKEESFLMYVEMPGVDHSSVDVSLEQHVLTIRGTSEFPSPEGYRVVSGDVSRRQYERSFHLSEDIDRERIEAEVKNGVLSLRLPKSQRAQRSKIAVRPA